MIELIIAVWLAILMTIPVWTKGLGINETIGETIYAIMCAISFIVWIWLDEADRADKERINRLFDEADENMRNLARMPMPSTEEIRKDIEEAKRFAIEQSERETL